jgi:hypothetical protein
MSSAKKTERASIWAFIKGFSSAFDLTGSTYIFIPDLMNGQERDKAAMREDWNCVGGDIKQSMFIVANE